MTDKLTNFLNKISQGAARKVLLNNTQRLVKNIEGKEIILEIKQKHALKKLQKSALFLKIKDKIQKIYGKDFSLNLRLKPNTTQHNREMNISHAVHY
jgi:hypothetical protein